MKQILKLTGLLLSLLIQNGYSQDKGTQDRNAIKSMCGCFRVGFNFAETFSYANDSTYTPSKVKHDKALEWVELIEEGEKKLVLQHILIAGNPAKPMIIKHWRQDWIYENTDFYMYTKDNHWKYTSKNIPAVRGQWTQKVFQVDDSPRYEGSATWVHVDGKSYWENATSAPLPRREYTKRNDYNVTYRRNRHEITPTGWIHDQDNDKIIRETGKEDFILAQEKGVNTYTRVDNAQCLAAQQWWDKNQSVWTKVRGHWETIFDQKKDLSLFKKFEDRRLYSHLFDLKNNANKKEIKRIINGFVQRQ